MFVDEGLQYWCDVAVASAASTCPRSLRTNANTDGAAARAEEAVAVAQLMFPPSLKTPTHSQNASELIELADIPDDTTVLETEGVVAGCDPDTVQGPLLPHWPHLDL